jgi:hypothetical protein
MGVYPESGILFYCNEKQYGIQSQSTSQNNPAGVPNIHTLLSGRTQTCDSIYIDFFLSFNLIHGDKKKQLLAVDE